MQSRSGNATYNVYFEVDDRKLSITMIVIPKFLWCCNHCENFSMVVFQHYNSYTVLHLVCTNTWSL